jgi:hypothetical protein
MEAAELHDRYTELLIDRTRSVRYPSSGIMDRTELTLSSRELALDYAEALLEKNDVRYPSLQLLDRLNRVLAILEATAPSEER